MTIKERWKKIKTLNKGKIFQIVISILIVIVSFIVVTLNYVGIYKFDDSNLLSIIIVLLCNVAIIYVFDEIDIFAEINRQLIDMPNNIQNQISDLYQNMMSNKSNNIIRSRKKLENLISINEIWEGASEVYLLALANTGFLKGNGISKIKDAIKEGIRFKIVSISPDFPALKEYIESNIISETSLPVSDNINAYIYNCNKSNLKHDEVDFKEMVEMRLTTFLLPYSMMIVKKGNRIKRIKVDIYGVDVEYMERRSFYINEEDEENINYYINQWNKVWNNGEKTIPVDITKRY